VEPSGGKEPGEAGEEREPPEHPRYPRRRQLESTGTDLPPSADATPYTPTTVTPLPGCGRYISTEKEYCKGWQRRIK